MPRQLTQSGSGLAKFTSVPVPKQREHLPSPRMNLRLSQSVQGFHLKRMELSPSGQIRLVPLTAEGFGAVPH